MKTFKLTMLLPFLLFFATSFTMGKAQQDSTATIYVIRTSVVAAAMKIPVLINEQPVGKLGAKKYFEYRVPAGDITVKAKMENESEVHIHTEKGQMYYVKMEILPSFLARVSLKELSLAESADALSKCKKQGTGK